ncbi:MAG: carboxypeptidase regulatory-like domain-containing protein, partial [Elusimicrobiota bacterium]|nr:carboxypeptidase regulatory-like domain-containing protein [Elusimicrobiota bacterium]
AKDNVLTKSFGVDLPEEWRNVPTIIGRVVESGTENGIPGIKLKLEGPVTRDVISGAGGQYKFEKLIKGQYKISAAGEGIEGDVISVNVSEDKAYAGNRISVSAAGARVPESAEEKGTAVVKGQVFSGAEKNPLGKALIKLMRKTPGGEYRSAGETRSSDKGFYKMMDIRSGSYNIIFEKEGFESNIKEIEVKKGAVVIIDCSLMEKTLIDAPEDYTADEAWQIIRVKIKDNSVLSALEGYTASDITISGSLKDALDAIKAGKLKIKNAEVEISR